MAGDQAVTVILALTILGEHVSALEATAVFVTIGGVVVVSADVSRLAAARIDRRSMQGLALALAAMVLFGGFLFGKNLFSHKFAGTFQRRKGRVVPVTLQVRLAVRRTGRGPRLRGRFRLRRGRRGLPSGGHV